MVSVIVLPRKRARLRRCIESIRAVSTYPDMEILVLDDGGFRPPMRQFLRDRADWLTVIEDDRDLRILRNGTLLPSQPMEACWYSSTTTSRYSIPDGWKR